MRGHIVLVIHNDPRIVRRLKETFASLGDRHDWARSQEDARRLLGANDCTDILLDLEIPACSKGGNASEVATLRNNLIAAGVTVWWDKDILPGQDREFEIGKALKQSYAVVVCLSEKSMARSKAGIYPELSGAINAYRQYAPGSVFLIPVRLSECEIPPVEVDATRTLNRLKCVDLFPVRKRAEGVKQLLQALQSAACGV